MARYRPTTVSSERRRLLGPVLGAALAALLAWEVHSGAAGSVAIGTLSITPGAVLPGEIVEVEVRFQTAVPLGAYSVDVLCDPELFSIETVRGGATPEFANPPFRNVSNCSARLSAFQIVSLDSPSGDVSVARLEIRARDGAAPTPASLVDLSVRSLDDTGGSPIEVVDVDASIAVDTLCANGLLDAGEDCDDGDPWRRGESCGVECTVVGCGDPDDSGAITATDALFVLLAAVGVESCAPCVCDVDAGGGPVSASDALRVLTFSTGAGNMLSCPACP